MTLDSVLDQLRGRRLWLWLGVIVLVRLVMMLVVVNGADLAGDEAYYWDWGRRPDWGYYSKPPMIGWMMGAIGWLLFVFGVRPFARRDHVGDALEGARDGECLRVDERDLPGDIGVDEIRPGAIGRAVDRGQPGELDGAEARAFRRARPCRCGPAKWW